MFQSVLLQQEAALQDVAPVVHVEGIDLQGQRARHYDVQVARKLAAMGLGGIEGYYSLFGPPETQMITGIAETLGLALSGGSDFHGSHKPEIGLGTGMGKLRVPARLLDALRAARA